MARADIPETFQPESITYVIPTYGRIRQARVIKRTATQITTEDLQGRKERWISSLSSTDSPGEDFLQPYGTASTYGPLHATLVHAGSKRLADERDRRREHARKANLNAALDVARRHGRVEDLEVLLRMLPEAIAHAKTAQ